MWVVFCGVLWFECDVAGDDALLKNLLEQLPPGLQTAAELEKSLRSPQLYTSLSLFCFSLSSLSLFN